MFKIVNLMLCEFYHNKEEREKEKNMEEDPID